MFILLLKSSITNLELNYNEFQMEFYYMAMYLIARLNTNMIINHSLTLSSLINRKQIKSPYSICSSFIDCLCIKHSIQYRLVSIIIPLYDFCYISCLVLFFISCAHTSLSVIYFIHVLFHVFSLVYFFYFCLSYVLSLIQINLKSKIKKKNKRGRLWILVSYRINRRHSWFYIQPPQD